MPELPRAREGLPHLLGSHSLCCENVDSGIDINAHCSSAEVRHREE